jgi:hypothetical protein
VAVSAAHRLIGSGRTNEVRSATGRSAPNPITVWPKAPQITKWQMDHSLGPQLTQECGTPPLSQDVSIRHLMPATGYSRRGSSGVRGGIDAPTGWTYVLDLFAKHAAA